MVAAKTEGGLYIARGGARRLGEGVGLGRRAGGGLRRRVGVREEEGDGAGRPGFGWASAQSGKRVYFFLNMFRGKYCIEK